MGKILSSSFFSPARTSEPFSFIYRGPAAPHPTFRQHHRLGRSWFEQKERKNREAEKNAAAYAQADIARSRTLQHGKAEHDQQRAKRRNKPQNASLVKHAITLTQPSATRRLERKGKPSANEAPVTLRVAARGVLLAPRSLRRPNVPALLTFSQSPCSEKSAGCATGFWPYNPRT